MSQKYTPAFPTTYLEDGYTEEGITMRDYFAAKAMQALIPDTNSEFWARDVAKAAYQAADAMLKAREQEPKV